MTDTGAAAQNTAAQNTVARNAVARNAVARNKAAVRAFFDRMNAGDVAGAFDLLTDDAAWFSLSTRRFSDRDQMRASIDWVNTELLRAPIQQTITTLTAEDDRVAALTEGHAVTVAGRHYDQAYHFLFEFSGERISRLWEFNDTYHSRTVFALSEAGDLPRTDPA
ncbi:nuclear transport factor 2 family protein [Frankia sp. AvcI1]|uniref:nuclear transport factor 2 family protein n=2 Tax=Frankia sp. AvcI1 TaxID=573496 RepID=UPI0021195D1F|nr:nuclear transport factor 2 family protein [Frankia sp. AvcI1]